MCVSFYYFPDSQRSCHSCRIRLDSLLSRFYGSVRTKISMNEILYKTNIDCFFIRGMVENYCTLGKTQPWPTIHLSPTGLGE